MRLTKELAAQILRKSHAILDREILMADTDGAILAGSSAVRFSPEAAKASAESRQLLADSGGQRVKWCPFVYDDQTLGVFGVLVDDTPITQEAISLLQGLAEVIVHQHFLLDRLQSTEMVRSDFIKTVLTAAQVNPAEIFRQADILQLNLRSPQAVILIRLGGFEARFRQTTSVLSEEERRLELGRTSEQVADEIRAVFQNFQHNLVAYLGQDTFALLKGIGGENLNTINTIRFLREKGHYLFEMLKSSQRELEITLGIGQYYPDIGGLRKSYQDARLALDVGAKVWGANRVYHIKDVGMFVSLANITQDRKAELAHQILHPLLRDQQLFKTVRNFLDSGLNLTEASERLHIHRNTLIYRLDKTKKLINLDPRHFDDALQIKLGLMFYPAAA